MKYRIIIYLLILILGVFLFLFKTYPDFKKAVAPNYYCKQFSGFHSYAWGGGSQRCESEGCKVIKLEVVDDPSIFDDEGFKFKCISK